VERVEPARPELRREHPPGAGELAPEAAGEHPVDHRRVLEDHVEGRVRDDLLGERLAQVPLDAPVALDEVGEVRGGRDAVKAEVPPRRFRLEDPAPARALQHVAFLQYGRARGP
jgi:hypothetical protein